MAFGDQDLPTFVKDFGVPVVLGAYTTNGILDTYDTREAQSQAMLDLVEKYRSVMIASGSLPGLVNESAITVNGVAAKVRDILQSLDGAFTHVFWVTP